MNRDCTNSFTFTDENGRELYKITFMSIIDNKWTYFVEKLSQDAHDISNWALEICKDATVTDSNPEGAEIGDPNQGVGQGNCLNINNPIGCFDSQLPIVEKQIKWNTTGGTFEFTLDQCYVTGCVHVAIKAGNECFCGMIEGPTCETCPPDPGRGILFI